MDEYESDPMQNYQMSSPVEDSSNNLRWQLEPVEVIQEIELLLRGKQYVSGKGIQDKGRALLNDEGVKSCIVVLRSHLNHNNVLGVLDKAEAYKITKDVAHLINQSIFLNQYAWNVRIQDWPIINNVIRNQVFIFLTRPVGGGERDRLTQTFKVGESYSQKRGRLQNLFGNKNQEEEQHG